MSMGFDETLRKWICADALDLVRFGRLDATHLFLIQMADEGDAQSLDLLHATVSSYRLGGPPLSVRQMGLSEADLPAILGSAESPEKSSFKISLLTQSVLRDKSHRFFPAINVPPRPLSNDFAGYLLGQSERTFSHMMLLKMVRQWPDVLVPVFYRIMGKGIDDWNKDALELRRAEIERRREWFDDLRSIGVEFHRLKHYFMDQMHAGLCDESIRAMAWLNSFEPAIEMNGVIARLASALLVYEIHQVHRLDPEKRGREFSDLLTPFYERMDHDSIAQNLSAADMPYDKESASMALRIARWHDEPSEEQLHWLIETVEQGDPSGGLPQFCEKVFATSIDALGNKIAALQDAGLDINPLLEALVRKFNKGGMGNDKGGSTPPESGSPDSSFNEGDELKRVGMALTDRIEGAVDNALESGMNALAEPTDDSLETHDNFPALLHTPFTPAMLAS